MNAVVTIPAQPAPPPPYEVIHMQQSLRKARAEAKALEEMIRQGLKNGNLAAIAESFVEWRDIEQESILESQCMALCENGAG